MGERWHHGAPVCSRYIESHTSLNELAPGKNTTIQSVGRPLLIKLNRKGTIRVCGEKERNISVSY